MFPPSSQCTDCTSILCLCPFIWSSQSNGGKALLKTLSFIYLCEVIKYVCVVAFVNKPTKNWPATDVKVRTGNKYTSTHSPPNWQGLTCVSVTLQAPPAHRWKCPSPRRPLRSRSTGLRETLEQLLSPDTWLRLVPQVSFNIFSSILFARRAGG